MKNACHSEAGDSRAEEPLSCKLGHSTKSNRPIWSRRVLSLRKPVIAFAMDHASTPEWQYAVRLRNAICSCGVLRRAAPASG